MTPLRGLFVTGTDTGVGKTVLAGAIVASLRAAGEAVAAFKPVVTGLDETVDPDWPPDHALLAAAAGSRPDAVAPHRFGPAFSPHLAAEMAGEPLEPAELVAAARAAMEEGAAAACGAAGEGAAQRVLVVEGVGGLLVPLTDDFLVRDLAVELGLPLVVAARPGLGTINHTLLTVEAARAAGLVVAAVVLGPWPRSPSVVETSNRATIERLAGVEVATLPHVDRATPGLLAAAGRKLAVARWVG